MQIIDTIKKGKREFETAIEWSPERDKIWAGTKKLLKNVISHTIDEMIVEERKPSEAENQHIGLEMKRRGFNQCSTLQRERGERIKSTIKSIKHS